MRRLFFLVAAALAPRAVQAQTLLADPILSTIEQDLAVAQNLLKVLSAEGKAAAIKSAEGKTALRGAQTTLEETFEYAEVNRLRAMRDETILSKTDSRDALTAHDLAFSHGTVFDIENTPSASRCTARRREPTTRTTRASSRSRRRLVCRRTCLT